MKIAQFQRRKIERKKQKKNYPTAMLIEAEKDNLCLIATKCKRYKLSIIFVSFKSGKIGRRFTRDVLCVKLCECMKYELKWAFFAECATAVAAKAAEAAAATPTTQTMIKSDKRKSTKFD